MPSTSGKQHNFMAAVANNPKFAKKAGVPQSVGAEFMKADTGRKFKEGGEMKESKEMMKKEVGFMKKAGAPRSMIKHEESEMKGMKMKKMGGYASGGAMPMVMKGGKKVPAFVADGRSEMAHGGMAAGHKQANGMAKKGQTKGMMVKMAAGGLAAGHKQADGIASKGKTKAKQVGMAMGGKTC